MMNTANGNFFIDSDGELKIMSLVKVVVGIFLLLIVLFNLPFVIVGPGERGVVVNLGRVSDVVYDEGMHFKMPFIQSVKIISVRVQATERLAQAASKDGQVVKVKVLTNWHLDSKSVNVSYQKFGSTNDIEINLLSPAVNEVVKAATAQKPALEILSSRPQIKAAIDKLLAERMKKYNVIIDDVSLVDVDFDPRFNEALEDKQIAEQKVKQADFNAQKAAKDAEATVNKAKGDAESQRLQQASLSPELLQKMAIERWDGKLPVYSGGSQMLFNLPIGN